MFFEPGQFPDEIGNTTEKGNVYPVGFSRVPGYDTGVQVLNDHSYCC
jgi:hypothetical protein